MLLFHSRHLALNSPLGHFNGNNARLLPNLPDTQKLVTPIPPTATCFSLNYGEHNPLHVRRHTLPSQPSHKSISSPYCIFTHNLSTSPASQTQTTFSRLQIKLIPKNAFRLSASYFFILSFIYFTNSARK